jgi:gamma-glutamyltranspeptidase/glutathione hydrolase
MIEGKEITSSRGAVVAGPEEAARIGARVIEAGGNAFDGAAAACLACAMLAPQSNGVGGYMLVAVVLEGKSGRVWSLDANARAPAAAREDMFELGPAGAGGGLNESEYGCSVKGDANVYGPLAVAVPGQMAGIGTLWERWGRMKWEEIVAPSLELLSTGFPYGPLASAIRTHEGILGKFEATATHLMPDGLLPDADDLWHRPDMEKTLQRLMEAGWRDFYDGEIGRRIADHLSGTGGILTQEDMAGFEPRITEPYAAEYRGVPVYGPILANGCLSSLQSLQMLDLFDAVADTEVIYWHRLAEVLKLSWRDRLNYLGDPEYTDVPVERLLSRDYAAGRVEALRRAPEQVDRQRFRAAGKGVPETLHVSAADSEGNVASVTITQGAAFGSCVTVPGTGIILGHGMCRLDPNPGRANSVAPGKRPLNNTAPMILRLADRDVALGMPGGRRIISVGVQLAQRVVDFGATSHEAASAPRLHLVAEEPLEVLDTLDERIVGGLREMGHEVKVVGGIGGGSQNAEFLRAEGKVRAGGNGWAAGV